MKKGEGGGRQGELRREHKGTKKKEKRNKEATENLLSKPEGRWQ